MGLIRVKYYIGWKLAQSTITYSGLSYNPKVELRKNDDTEESSIYLILEVIIDDFDKNENCTLKKIELEINPKLKIQYWNRSVHLWLKYNVYIRLINIEHELFKGKDSTASLVSFVLSAIWHGFYPMYYVFFFEFWLLEQSCTMLDKKLGFYEKIEKSNVIVRMIVLTITMNLMNVLGLQFGLLLYTNNYLLCRNLYFIPNLFLVGMYIYLAFFVKGKRTPRPDVKNENKVEETSNGKIDSNISNKKNE